MSGFSFGTPNTQSAAKPAGFSFGSLTSPQSNITTAPAFGFPSLSNTTPMVANGFSLGTSTPSTQPATTPTAEFSFGPLGSIKLPVVTGSFSLGTLSPIQQSANQNAPSFALGTATSTTPPTIASGFSSGNAFAASQPANQSTFNFGSTNPAVTGGFSVGSPALTTQLTSQPTQPFSFGSTVAPAASGGFSLTGLPTTTKSDVNLMSTSIFGTPSVTTPPATTTKPTGITSNFSFGLGSKPTPTTTAALSFATLATTTVAPATSGFSLGLKTTSGMTTTEANSPFTLAASKVPGNASTFAAPSLTPATTVTAPATTATTSGLGFGTPKSGVTSTPAGAFSIGLIKSTAPTLTNAAVTTVSGASTNTAVPAAPAPQLTYRQLEDMVNKWTYELDEQSQNFSSELGRLNKADRVLVENGEKISDLHSKVEACKAGQSRIEQELEFVESQQRNLEDLLEPLEQAAIDLPPSQQHADAEREAIFQMCINTDVELGQLLSELREMAERVNTITTGLEKTNVGGSDKDHPTGSTDKTAVIGQVTRILNSHMHSLNWLNQNMQELMEKFITHT